MFQKVARIQMLIELFNSSVDCKKYDIAYELIRRFVGDFLRAQSLPIFGTLLQQFIDDTSRYEAKIALLLNLLPVMNRKVGSQFMKIMEEVLGEPASNSFFRNNVNPMRVGLMLIRAVTEVQETFGFSQNTTDIILEDLT